MKELTGMWRRTDERLCDVVLAEIRPRVREIDEHCD